MSVAYALAAVDVPADPLEEWLVEQLEALTDELFSRVYRPVQRPWNEDDCPWHRRLRESGMTDADCPICTQIGRSRRVPVR